MALDAPLKDVDLYTDIEVWTLLDWYNAFKSEYWKPLYKIFKLPADDTLWDKYIQFGTTGMPEQLLFDNAARQARKAWNKAYRPNRKLNREKDKTDVQRPQENPAGVSVQPATAQSPVDHC